MANPWFAFKQFTVWQDRTAMKVTTDGVLLGAWVNTGREPQRILDIGTGTGLIALMMAQRCPQAQVDALEIDPDAAQQARENMERSPWHDRLQVLPVPLQEFVAGIPGSYDLLVCNPPYFEQSLRPADPSRSLARHADLLAPEELVQGAAGILRPHGILGVIVPFSAAPRLLSLAQDRGLYGIRLCRVISRQGRKPERMMMEFSPEPATRLTEELVIEAEGFTESYRELTREFYLKF